MRLTTYMVLTRATPEQRGDDDVWLGMSAAWLHAHAGALSEDTRTATRRQCFALLAIVCVLCSSALFISGIAVPIAIAASYSPCAQLRARLDRNATDEAAAGQARTATAAHGSGSHVDKYGLRGFRVRTYMELGQSRSDGGGGSRRGLMVIAPARVQEGASAAELRERAVASKRSDATAWMSELNCTVALAALDERGMTT